jgi:hypothetical protein
VNSAKINMNVLVNSAKINMDVQMSLL